jgi:hypothetical protein
VTNANEIREAVNKSHQERFLKYVRKDPDSGCWQWTGARLGNGHPVFRFRGRSAYCRRVAWILWKCELDANQHVFPKITCRLERLCANPDHMMLSSGGGWYAAIRLAQKRLIRMMPEIILSLKHTSACRSESCSTCLEAINLAERIEQMDLPQAKARPNRIS